MRMGTGGLIVHECGVAPKSTGRSCRTLHGKPATAWLAASTPQNLASERPLRQPETKARKSLPLALALPLALPLQARHVERIPLALMGTAGTSTLLYLLLSLSLVLMTRSGPLS